MGQLQLADGSDGPARCVVCAADAQGPCAHCEAPLCADCCVIVAGAARSYALCPGCAADGDRKLRGGWMTVLGWVLWPIAALTVVVLLLEQCR